MCIRDSLDSELAAFEAELVAFEALLLTELQLDLALNQVTPVRVAAASQTATNSELFMYLGALILMLTFIYRRRLAA